MRLWDWPFFSTAVVVIAGIYVITYYVYVYT